MNSERRIQEIQEVIGKLRFLSKIKKGERLNVEGLSVVGATWYDKLWRAWNTMGERDIGQVKESREKSLEFIKELYETSLRLAKTIIEEGSSYYTDLWNMLLKSMKDAQPGILNLMSYYESDRLYIAKAETFVDILNAKIHDLEAERSSYFIQEDTFNGDEDFINKN